MTDIHQCVENQRAFFRTGTTLDLSWRLRQLKTLRSCILANQEKIEKALAADLGRHPLEAYFCDTGTLLLEINETAFAQIDLIVRQLLKAYPAPDRSVDHLAYVAHMNSLTAMAEETVLHDLIYV